MSITCVGFFLFVQRERILLGAVSSRFNNGKITAEGKGGYRAVKFEGSRR